MAISTRRRRYKTPLGHSIRRREHSTESRVRFFHAVDTRTPSKTIASVARLEDITTPTARRMLKERENFGKLAHRRSRPRSDKLGPKPKTSERMCKFLVSKENVVANQSYEAQIAYHNLDCKKRSLQARLKKCTKQGQRYKNLCIKKRLTRKHRDSRIKYGHTHLSKPIPEWWDHQVFTDEAHVDPLAQNSE
jgi:hypothetical protein